MAPVPSFLLGLGLMLAICFAILRFVREPLRRLLIELCEGEHRASFWHHLFEVFQFLAVSFAAVLFPPAEAQAAGFFDFLGMFRAGLFALILGLGLLAVVMMLSIRGYERRAAAAQRRRPPELPRAGAEPSGEPA